MIDLTPYSIFWVCIVSSIFITLLVLISKSTKLVSGVPMWLTIAVFAVVAVRLVLPVEFLGISKTCTDYKVLPGIYDFITYSSGKIWIFDKTILNYIYLIWFGISAALLVYYIVQNFMMCRYIRRTPAALGRECDMLDKLKKKLNCRFKTKLIVSDAIPFPSEYGYFKHIIFLNKADYTDEELEFILTHELYHFKCGTQWFKLLSEVLWILFWWNPIIYFYKKHLTARIEIYVDSKITKRLAAGQVKTYLQAIFKVYYGNTDKSALTPPFVGTLVQEDEKLLKQRFILLSAPRKMNIPLCLAVTALTAAYLFVSCRYIVQPGWKPSPIDMPPFGLVLSPQNSYILYENGEYRLYCYGELLVAEIKDPSIFENVPVLDKPPED